MPSFPNANGQGAFTRSINPWLFSGRGIGEGREEGGLGILSSTARESSSHRTTDMSALRRAICCGDPHLPVSAVRGFSAGALR